MTKKSHRYVDSPKSLERCLSALASEERFALDLEADSYHHYQEKICLIQIALPRQVYIIDPLANLNLTPLAKILANRRIEKVMHGADYDGRIIMRHLGVRTINIFDTMLASKILGKKRVGLAPLLEEHFGVILDKRYQRADWSKRPLSPELLEYAAMDVRFLLPLRRELVKQLGNMGRLTWAHEEFGLLEKSLQPLPERPSSYHKIKGASGLEPQERSILDSLLKWRDGVARKRDLPPFKILPNHCLLELARLRPNNWKALRDTGVLSLHNLEHYGASLLRAIERGARMLPEDRPTIIKERTRRNPGTEKRINRLKVWRANFSRYAGIDPGVLLPNSVLESIAALNPRGMDDLIDSGLLKHWQLHLFGEELVQILKFSAIR